MVSLPGPVAEPGIGAAPKPGSHPTQMALYLYSLILLPPLGYAILKEKHLSHIYFCISCS